MQNNFFLIENPYYIPTKHFKNNKFCPNAIFFKKCKMPCPWFDTSYCTAIYYSKTQEKAAKEWRRNNAE